MNQMQEDSIMNELKCEPFKDLSGFEEITIRDFLHEQSECKIYHINGPTRASSTLSLSYQYRKVEERYDRIFFHSNHSFICSVDKCSLTLRVVETKSASNNSKDTNKNEDTIILKFDSPIVRDLIFVQYKEELDVSGILAVPLAIGAVYLFPIGKKGLNFPQGQIMPACKIYFTVGEADGEKASNPLPIKRMTDLWLCEDHRDLYIHIGIIHPQSGVFQYQLPLNEPDMFSCIENKPSEKVITCVSRKGHSKGFFKNLKTSIFGSQGEEEIMFNEISYIGNGLIVATTEDSVAQLRSLKTGDILAEISLPRVHQGFIYQIGKILNDPVKPNTEDLLNIVIIFGEIPINITEAMMYVPESSVLMFWRISLHNKLKANCRSFDEVIHDPSLWTDPRVVVEHSTESRLIKHSTIVAFNTNISNELLISVYNHVSSISEILCYDLENGGYKIQAVYTQDEKLVKMLIEDWIISTSCSIKDASKYLLDRLMQTNRFSSSVLKGVINDSYSLGKLLKRDTNQIISNDKTIHSKHLIHDLLERIYIKSEEKGAAYESIFELIKSATSRALANSFVTIISNDTRHENMTYVFRSNSSLSLLLKTEMEQTASDILSKDRNNRFVTKHFEQYTCLRILETDYCNLTTDVCNQNTRITTIAKRYINDTIKTEGLGSLAECFSCEDDLKLYEIVKNCRRLLRLETESGFAFQIDPSIVIRATLEQGESGNAEISNWEDRCSFIFNLLLSKTQSDEIFEYIAKVFVREDQIRAFIEIMDTQNLESLQGVAENITIGERKRSPALTMSVPYLKCVGHLLARYTQLGAEFISYSIAHSMILNRFAKIGLGSKFSKLQANIQPYIAMNKLFTTNLRSANNISLFLSSSKLSNLIYWTQEISVAIDIVLHYYANLSKQIKGIVDKGSKDFAYDWINTTANSLLDIVSFSTPDTYPEYMKHLNLYLLSSNNEITNYECLATLVSFSNPFSSYCKALWCIHTGRSKEASKLAFRIAGYIQLNLNLVDDTNKGRFFRGPWYYLHSQPLASQTNSFSVSTFFDLFFTNVSQQDRGLICNMGVALCDVAMVNFDTKKKYLSAYINKKVKEHAPRDVYNVIIGFKDPREKEELFKLFVTKLADNNCLQDIEELFRSNKENPIIMKVLWQNIQRDSSNLRSALLKRGIYVVIEQSLKHLRNWYSLLYRQYFIPGDYKEAGSVYFDEFKLLAEIYIELYSNLGKESKQEFIRAMIECLNNSLVCLEILDTPGQLGYAKCRGWRKECNFSYNKFISFFKFEEGIITHRNDSKNFYGIIEIEKFITTLQAALILENSSLTAEDLRRKDAPILAYIALDDIERAVVFCKQFPQRMVELGKLLIPLWIDKQSMIGEDVYERSIEKSIIQKIWPTLMICAKTLDSASHSTKLSFLKTILAIERQIDFEKLQIPDDFHQLLLRSCPVKYGMYLVKFNFLEDAIDILYETLTAMKEEINTSMIDPKVRRKNSVFFDPLLLKRTLSELRSKCIKTGLQDHFDAFIEEFTDGLHELLAN